MTNNKGKYIALYDYSAADDDEGLLYIVIHISIDSIIVFNDALCYFFYKIFCFHRSHFTFNISNDYISQRNQKRPKT